MKYSAKDDYQSDETARTYESREMYSGFLGRRRKKIEQSVIAQLIASMQTDSVILDCPCGNGRWFEALGAKASRIIARDISQGQTNMAMERASALSVPHDIAISSADKLDLDDKSVDHVFCYALMKHLPVPLQYNVLKEFSRVSRGPIYCSFAVLGHITYARWRHTRQKQSFPIIAEEIEFMAEQSDLKLVELKRVSQPIIGLEYFAVFEPVDDMEAN